MTEADIIENMVEYQNILLLGVSVFFTVISAYVVAIWAFLRHAGIGLRAFSFFFLTLVTAFLGRVAYGSQLIHDGFIDTLIEIERTTGLSPTGQAALNNALSGLDNAEADRRRAAAGPGAPGRPGAARAGGGPGGAGPLARARRGAFPRPWRRAGRRAR